MSEVNHEVRIEALHAACAMMANTQESSREKLVAQTLKIAGEFERFINTGEVPHTDETKNLNLDLVYRGHLRQIDGGRARSAA